METIRTYVENIFSTLQKTTELKKLKQEILMNMEEKYCELKAEGKSENEAIGIVISEFGNIDEIINEFDIKVEKDDSLRALELDKINEIVETTKKSNFIVSLGVMLIISGLAFLILIFQLYDDGILFSNIWGEVNLIGIGGLLFLVGCGVGLIILSGSKTEKFKFIDEGLFSLSYGARATLEKDLESIKGSSNLWTIIGVVLCIISPISIFIGGIIGDSGYVYGTVILILMVAVAVFLFINKSGATEIYKKLLKIEEYSDISRKGNKLIDAVAGVVWPLTTVVFLVWSFLFNGWAISWVVFPVVGILFGIFVSAYKAIKGIRY